MPYFRKTPSVVEATQWFKDGDHPAAFLCTTGGQVWVNGQSYVETREGMRLVLPGDWIIKDAKGEFYPCKPDIFAMTYVEA